MSSTVSPQAPMPGSIDAIFPFASHVSRTALTCAKRFAHSRLRDDDHLVRADHRVVEVRRRRHREADVRAPAPHLHLVVHDHRPRAALDARPRRPRAACVVVVVVADDRDDVALLDGHADVDDERRVLRAGSSGSTAVAIYITLSRSRVNRGSTSRAKRPTWPNWSMAPKRQMKWSTPGLGERLDPVGDLVRRADRAPVRQVHRLRQLGVVLRDVVAEGRARLVLRVADVHRHLVGDDEPVEVGLEAVGRAPQPVELLDELLRDAARGSTSSSRRRSGGSAGSRPRAGAP